MRPMRWVICALVVLALPPGALAADLDGDFDALRGPQQVGSPTYTRWSGVYGGFQFGEEFNGADFRGVAGPDISTISALDQGFSGIPLGNFPNLGSINTETKSYSGFLGYNYQFESAVVGVELNFSLTSLNASITDAETHRYFQNANNTLYLADYNVNTTAAARLKDYGSMRGRFGWVFGNFLPYSFGGIVVSQINSSKSINVNYCGEEAPYTCTNPPPASNPPPPAAIGGNWTLADQNDGKWYIGFTAGIGLDYAVTQNIFLRGELSYVQFGSPDSIKLSTTSARIGAGLKF
jgi:outer membrane immunogenic protein